MIEHLEPIYLLMRSLSAQALTRKADSSNNLAVVVGSGYIGCIRKVHLWHEEIVPSEPGRKLLVFKGLANSYEYRCRR